jgi:site-specific DNA-methyltransferase (adenine-specific)
MKVTDKIVITCEDNMELMSRYPDKHFELAIVDPPYGMDIKMDGTGGAGRIMRRWKRTAPTWDIKPNQDYFDELFRVSKNQIIWGANNFIENSIEAGILLFLEMACSTAVACCH